MSAGSGSVGQQAREATHPPLDGDVVDLDAAFGEEFLDVAVGPSLDDAARARRLVGLTLGTTGTGCLQLELSTSGRRARKSFQVSGVVTQ
jgi:hypothetical protein